MSIHVHGPSAPAAALRPLLELRACCSGASMYGAGYCTCWEPQYDLDQRPPQTALIPQTMPTMCADCAYRPNSPERNDDDRYTPPPAATSEAPFYCHDGMRRPVTFRHPAGITVVADVDAYDPLIVDGVPYRADGRPGSRCAGWSAHHEVAMRARLADEDAARVGADVDLIVLDELS